MADLTGEWLPGAIVAPVVAWYLGMLALGVVGLIPAMLLFDALPSRGVFVARPIALATVGLLTWLLVHLTPLTYGTPMVLLSLGLVAVAAGGLGWWRRTRLLEARSGWRSGWRGLATAELLTLVVFVVVLLLRVQTPDAWGTEKPSDLMLLTAVHRAEGFPPPDPWLAGETLSYYHLGQVQMDHLGRIAGREPAETFNLITATAGAMAAAAAVGLATDLVRLNARVRRRTVVAAGVVATAGLLLVAPLVGVVQVLAANGVGGESPWGSLGVEGVPVAAGATTLVPDAFWWWWPTTRVVPGVISEYPAFTLILGDPHAHLMALPLGLTALALAVQVFAGTTPLTWRRWLARPETLVLTSVVFAALAMSSSWDVVTYGGLWAVAGWWAVTRAGWPLPLGAFVVVRWALAPTVLALLFAGPLLATLDPAPLGVAPVTGESSDLGRWLLFWLPVLLPVILAALVALLYSSASGRPRWQYAGRAVVVPAAAVAAWVVWQVARGDAGEVIARGGGWVTLGVLAAAMAGGSVAAWSRARRADERGTEAAWWLIAGAFAVLLLTELVHVDDLFPGRLNTAFKFWFHAWAILAVAGGVLAALAVERQPTAMRRVEGDPLGAREHRPAAGGGTRGAGAVVVILVGLWLTSMVTSPMMAVSRAREGQEPALSALAHLERRSPDLAQAITWGMSELDPARHVIVELVGESYTMGNRFSSFTAVPTILAWPGHERQWRTEISEAERRRAVDAIYAGTDEERRAAIARWGVTHVVVGPDERATHGQGVASQFSRWPAAFVTPTWEVYEVPQSEPPSVAPQSGPPQSGLPSDVTEPLAAGVPR